MSAETVLFAILGFFGGIYLLFYGFSMYKRYQLIRDTPTSNVQSMSLGTVELKGEVKPSDNEDKIYKHPFEDEDDCVYYKRKVEKHNPDDDGSDWDQVLTEQVGDEFYLNDDTGEVLVKIEDPDFDLENEARIRHKFKVGPNDDVPRALHGTKAGKDSSLIPDFLEGQKYRVTVEAIWPDMDLFIFGHARTRDAEETFSTNEKNIVVGNIEESSSQTVASSLPLLGKSKPFIIANQNEDKLISERKFLGPASFFGGLLLSSGCLYYLLTVFGV